MVDGNAQPEACQDFVFRSEPLRSDCQRCSQDRLGLCKYRGDVPSVMHVNDAPSKRKHGHAQWTKDEHRLIVLHKSPGSCDAELHLV